MNHPQRAFKHDRHGVSHYDPRFSDDNYVRWVGFTVLGAGLAGFGALLGMESLAQRGRGTATGGWLATASAATAAVGFGLGFLAEGARRRDAYLAEQPDLRQQADS